MGREYVHTAMKILKATKFSKTLKEGGHENNCIASIGIYIKRSTGGLPLK